MQQVAFSFDDETRYKIVKGLLYSALGGITAVLRQYQTSGNFKASLLTGLITMLVPFGANASVQYVKGD